jgi:hypothetical protein
LSQSVIAPKGAHFVPQAKVDANLDNTLSYHSPTKLQESCQSSVTVIQMWPKLGENQYPRNRPNS